MPLEPVRNRITLRPTCSFRRAFSPKPSTWFTKQSDFHEKTASQIASLGLVIYSGQAPRSGLKTDTSQMTPIFSHWQGELSEGIAQLVRVKNMHVFLLTHLSGALDLLSGVNNAR
jgi:hypothetical protein